MLLRRDEHEQQQCVSPGGFDAFFSAPCCQTFLLRHAHESSANQHVKKAAGETYCTERRPAAGLIMTLRTGCHFRLWVQLHFCKTDENSAEA